MGWAEGQAWLPVRYLRSELRQATQGLVIPGREGGTGLCGQPGRTGKGSELGRHRQRQPREDPGDEHQTGKRPEKRPAARATAIYQMPSTCQHEAGHVGAIPHAVFAEEGTKAQVPLPSGEPRRCSRPPCGCSPGGHGVQGEETLVILASLGAWPTSRQGPRGLVSALLRVEEGELQWQGQRPHGRAKWLLFHPQLPGRPRAPSGRKCPRVGEGLGPRVIQRQT